MASCVIARAEENIAALKLRLPGLEGKAHKKERSQVNKEIYALENGEAYVAAVKAARDSVRAAAAAAEDAVQREVAAAEAAENDDDESTWARNGCAETQNELTLRIYWRNQVEGLFDDYAPTFEDSLVRKLGYDIPAKLEAALARSHAAEDGSLSTNLAVDLGCGTGLAGARLRERCRGRLIGCDLSRRMVAEARKKVGVFDSLEACDCIAYLHRRVDASTADLIVAADVLIYLRDLTDLFAAVAVALRAGGLFAFSTELGLDSECGGLPPAGRGWVERKSERVAHSEEYLRWAIASTDGLEMRSLEVTTIRNEAGVALQGHMCICEARSSSIHVVS